MNHVVDTPPSSGDVSPLQRHTANHPDTWSALLAPLRQHPTYLELAQQRQQTQIPLDQFTSKVAELISAHPEWGISIPENPTDKTVFFHQLFAGSLVDDFMPVFSVARRYSPLLGRASFGPEIHYLQTPENNNLSVQFSYQKGIRHQISEANESIIADKLPGLIDAYLAQYLDSGVIDQMIIPTILQVRVRYFINQDFPTITVSALDHDTSGSSDGKARFLMPDFHLSYELDTSGVVKPHTIAVSSRSLDY